MRRERIHVWSMKRIWILILLLIGGRVYGGWIDPDTDENDLTTQPLTVGDDRAYKLVLSDEFNVDGRTFYDGEDPRWTAINKNDYTNDALQYYKPENARTTNGVLNITTNQRENSFKAFNEKTKRFYPKTKHIQSAMLQGWNKFCFTGGIVEFRAKLPGKPFVGGLWPALWLLGNLARATYVGSSDYMWPWSYNKCDDKTGVSQEINACTKVNHYGMKEYEGRGAPEIDVLEGMGGEPGKLPNTPIQRPYFSASLQVAPGVRRHRPVLGNQPEKGRWYEGFEFGNVTKSALNPFFYGVTLVHKPKSYTYQSDALSCNMRIYETHFERHHVYRVEWEPSDMNGVGGYIRWFADGELVYGIEADVLNLTGAQIPNEPMYILMNTAVSSSWGFPKPCPAGCDCECFQCGNADCDCGLPEGFCENFPGHFEIDYVRVYQAVNESRHEVGCSTERRPTELFIKGNRKRYMSKGDKQPLLPVQSGGAVCTTVAQCGGFERGTCSKRGFCSCLAGHTGPRCLAYVGFDDHPYHPKERHIALKPMIFPLGLCLISGLILLAFLVNMAVDVRGKQREKRSYKKLPPPSTGMYEGRLPQLPGRYPGSPHDSLRSVTVNQKPQMDEGPKVITYCMIDGRLVDE